MRCGGRERTKRRRTAAMTKKKCRFAGLQMGGSGSIAMTVVVVVVV